MKIEEELDAERKDKKNPKPKVEPQPTNYGEKPIGLSLNSFGYSVINTSVIGANHEEKDLPNQDASAVVQYFYKGKPLTILAVADGHGSKKYSRSETGAFFAVHTVQLVLNEFLLNTASFNETSIKNIFKNRDIYKDIHSKWLELVKEHVKKNPKNRANPDSKSSIQQYGTTLLFAIIYEEKIYISALGDGSIYIVRRLSDGGIKIDNVFEEDSLQVGLGTDSMINPRATHRFKQKLCSIKDFNSKIEMILLTTDGMVDSLENPSKSIEDMFYKTRENGLDWLRKTLPRQLAKWSKDGVGDDMTNIVYFFD